MMTTTVTPLAIDGDALAKRMIMATAKDDLAAGIQPTGGIHAYIRAIFDITKSGRYRSGPITVFFDNGVPEYRTMAIQGYKSGREKRREKWTPEQRDALYGQMAVIREVTPLLGCAVGHTAGWEGDDGCAAFAARVPGALVMSSDGDLWQCVRWGARVLDLNTNDIIDTSNFDRHAECPVSLYTLKRLLVGDTSDSIKGAIGCGPAKVKTALDMVPAAEVARGDVTRQFNALVAAILRIPHDARAKWLTDIIRDRVRLRGEAIGIDLATAATLYPELPPEPPPPDKDALTDFVRRWRFTRLLAEIPSALPRLARR